MVRRNEPNPGDSGSVWINGRQLCQDLKRKILRSYSQALPIHAKTGREWEPESACSFTGLRMTDVVVVS